MRLGESNLSEARAYVPDSYALLVYPGAESGGEVVKQLLKAASQDECRLYMCICRLFCFCSVSV